MASKEAWVLFENERRTASKLTRIWDVNTRDGSGLGIVQWFPRWRCYVFVPTYGTVYERDCLRDIAEFCERQTNLNKQIARDRRGSQKGD